jgi:hypothetical protein
VRKFNKALLITQKKKKNPLRVITMKETLV